MSVLSAFLVLAVELDTGPLFLSGRSGKIGFDELTPAVLSFGAASAEGGSVSIEAQALPDYAQNGYWANREAMLLEVEPRAGSVYDGRVVFDGVVSAEPSEPSEQAGVLAITLAPFQRREVMLPGFGVIDAATYPDADPSAMGKSIPMIFGTVEACPLLAVKTSPSTTLSQPAQPGDVSLGVQDASALPASGAVWADNESIAYTSRTGTELLGCAVRDYHASGTAAVAAAESWHLAAGHDCTFSNITGGAAQLSPDVAQAHQVIFSHQPQVTGLAARNNVLLQFDRASGGTFAMQYPCAYPVAETVGAGSATYTVLGDLDVLIIPPATLTPGAYTFTLNVDAQARQDITNDASVYTATLGGVNFSVPKTGGTVTAVRNLTSSAPLQLRHDVTAALTPTDITTLSFQAGVNSGAMLDYKMASISGIDQIVPQISSVSVTWAEASVSNVALNPTNAIRAVTATVTHNATGWDSSIASTGSGNILFARPNADRIVLGAYTVAYTVALNGYGGAVRVTIGDQVVYAADGGAVIYNWSPCSLELDTDTDVLPVRVEGGAGVVVCTITAASRTVGTGNLDGGKYATLAWASNNRLFRAVQTDNNPDRGIIARVRLAIEWFGAGVIPANTVAVRWAGRIVGYLQAQTLTGSTVTRNVTVDVLTAGSATLAAQTINTTVSGGTASLSHTSQSFEAQITVPTMLNAETLYRGYAGTPSFMGWDYATFGYVEAHVAYYGADATAATNASYQEIIEFMTSGGGWAAATYLRTDTIVVGRIYAVVYGLSSKPDYCRFTALSGQYLMALTGVKFKWTGRITSGAVSQSNTPASGSTSHSLGSSQAVPVTTAPTLRTNNGDISVTIPDAPRTTITEFDLPDVTRWADMTGKVMEVELLSTCPNVYLLQVQLAVDYDSGASSTAGSLAANITGLSGNPADVLDYLAAQVDETLVPSALSRLRTWCSAHSYLYARRIDTPTDALQLFTFAAEQASVMLARTRDGLAPIRWFDLSSPVTLINENDLLEPAAIGWATRVETALTLNYRQDYAGNGWLRTLVADATNNRYCRIGESMLQASRVPVKRGDLMQRSIRASTLRGEAKIRGIKPMAIDGGFIRDDATAAYFLNETARRYAISRRVVDLPLPFTFSYLEEGALIEYLPRGKFSGEGIFGRITSVTNDQGWPRIQAEEILIN